MPLLNMSTGERVLWTVEDDGDGVVADKVDGVDGGTAVAVTQCPKSPRILEVYMELVKFISSDGSPLIIN
jgi:hypothetical protein